MVEFTYLDGSLIHINSLLAVAVYTCKDEGTRIYLFGDLEWVIEKKNCGRVIKMLESRQL